MGTLFSGIFDSELVSVILLFGFYALYDVCACCRVDSGRNVYV